MGWAERPEPREGWRSSPPPPTAGWVQLAGSCVLSRLRRPGCEKRLLIPCCAPPAALSPRAAERARAPWRMQGRLTWRKRAARGRPRPPPASATQPRADPEGRARPSAAAALCFRGCVAARSPLPAPPPAPAPVAGGSLARETTACAAGSGSTPSRPHPPSGRPPLQLHSLLPPVYHPLITRILDNLRPSGSGGHQGRQPTAKVRYRPPP